MKKLILARLMGLGPIFQKGLGVAKCKKLCPRENQDIVISKPGEKIPVDGIVLKGKTHTDESFITGESKPVSKAQGDKVIAGSINYDGYIEIKAENIGKDSSISHIVDMVVDATNSKAPIARFADKISGYFVPITMMIAIIRQAGRQLWKSHRLEGNGMDIEYMRVSVSII